MLIAHFSITSPRGTKLKPIPYRCRASTRRQYNKDENFVSKSTCTNKTVQRNKCDLCHSRKRAPVDFSIIHKKSKFNKANIHVHTM